jgi:peptide/nickel transport system substrate-binding protein
VNGDNWRLDRARDGQGAIENHVIDEFVAGRLTRRDFLRRGTVVGISLPVLGAVLAACGSSSPSSSSPGTGSSSSGSAPAGAAGATINVGIVTPAATINPLTIADQGGLDMLGQTGEYLIFSDQHLKLQPQLAESWSSNATGSVWTFKIRQGVKFHNGAAMTVDDVVYTFKLHSDPKKGGNALSAFGGVLTPDGVKKKDDSTVEFHLQAPNGNFPYLVSSDNYNTIILPNNYDPAKWESSFLGTGPFKMKSYTAKQGASFVRNESYWGTKALPAQTNFTFYDTQTPEILALTGGTIDVVGQFSVSGGEQLLNNSAYNVTRLKSAAHRELSMRCDQAPFTDPRVRQAIALSLDRPAIVKALFKGYADVGNDSPFAPVYPSTNTSIAQRAQDIAKAKSLLSAAGHSSFSTQLIGNDVLEISNYAQIVAQSAQAIGVKINVKMEATGAYYGKATFGNSDWLDATMSLVDYGHRTVPNIFLTAPLETTNAKKGTGPWNAAHFNNTQYNKLVGQYVAAVDLSSQRKIAGQIETLLLEQTPIIFGYFYNYLTATAKNVQGAFATPIGHIFLYKATKS